MKPCRSTLSLVTILALALSAAAFACGPQKKFCPGTPGQVDDGKCPIPMDGSTPDTGMPDAGNEDRGPVIIGSDAT